MARGDRHLQRTTEFGPSTGSYFTIPVYLPANTSAIKFQMPMAARLVEISRYATTSTAGTVTIANGTSSVTWLNAGTITAATVTLTPAATIAAAGSQACAKGDQINISGGGTFADGYLILTFYAKDHVAASEAND